LSELLWWMGKNVGREQEDWGTLNWKHLSLTLIWFRSPEVVQGASWRIRVCVKQVVYNTSGAVHIPECSYINTYIWHSFCLTIELCSGVFWHIMCWQLFHFKWANIEFCRSTSFWKRANPHTVCSLLIGVHNWQHSLCIIVGYICAK
jgi:hypothetical protein